MPSRAAALLLLAASDLASGLALPAAAVAPAGPITASRYVATNRFRVKPGREAAFEKRWADRKSRLGLLDGFRFFCMLRRTDRGEGRPPYEDDINYISCTVWEEFENFDAWKKGDAFKDAHGGGTIGGIASMLIATAQNTKGKPKAAMWEGLLPASGAGTGEPPAGGWREVVADGTTMLDGECFVAMNRFAVREGMHAAFEERFAARESNLAQCAGFKGFLLLRRDGDDPDGVTHSTWSVWEDRAAFEAWMSADKAPKGPKKPAAAAAGGGGAPPAGGPPPMYAKPPVPSFYEGLLMLESAEGI